jgi:hypothetical protein
MNQIEKLTLNYQVTENKLQALSSKIEQRRWAVTRSKSSKVVKDEATKQAASITNLAHMLNKVHFDKIKVVNSKKAHQHLKERVAQLKTEPPKGGLNTKGSLAQ